MEQIDEFRDRMIIRFADKYSEEGDSWKTASLSDLWDRLIRNVNELGHDIFRSATDLEQLRMQAADVGNMVWILTENIAEKKLVE